MGTQKTWIQTYRQKESAMLKEWWPYGCFYRQWVAMFVSIFKFLRKAECLAFSKYQGETVRNWSWSLEWKGQERTTSFLECEGPQSTFWECLRYFSAHSPSGLNCCNSVRGLCSSAAPCPCLLHLKHLFPQVHSPPPPRPHSDDAESSPS